MKKCLVLFMVFLFAGGLLAGEFDFSSIKNNISEFTLANGLKFILVEDHTAPVATFVTYVNVGSADEKIGIYGGTHFFEHMAFKGTSKIGTTNYKEEKILLDQMDTVFDKLIAEKGLPNPDSQKIKTLQDELDKLQADAGKYVVPNEFYNTLSYFGARNINASTDMDYTKYFYSLPSNKLELWAYMESNRFLDPVFREFHKERGVLQEERRMRIENDPQGKLIEQGLGLAFIAHPYHFHPCGPMSSLDNMRRQDLMEYFKANYTAPNMVIGIYGDVYPDQLKKIAEKYFLKIPTGRKTPRILTTEPQQIGEKSITLFETFQPAMAMGYHMPSRLHKDYLKFSLLSKILTAGRSSRLQKKIIIEDKSAIFIMSNYGMPGDKYDNMFIIMMAPSANHSNEELIKTITSEIAKIKTGGVTDDELTAAKINFKVAFIKKLNSNNGLLTQLLMLETVEGSWQKLFTQMTDIDKITKEDIQQLVKTYFTPTNCTLIRSEMKKEVTQ